MEEIIQQMIRKFTESIMEQLYAGKLGEIDVLMKGLQEQSQEFCNELVGAFITYMNEEIRKDKVFRKRSGLVIKQKERPRSIYTSTGIVEYMRDYYYDKESGRYEYVIDGMIGVEKYARIDDVVKAELVSGATEESYARSSKKVSGGAISRQTVRNAILQAEGMNVVVVTDGKKREVEVLYVYADEDHTHLQKPGKKKGKANQQVPLVVVTEGIEYENNRGKTINARRFVDKEFKGANIWAEVEGYIYSTYDVSKIKRIYIYGDGGSWIKNGLENMPNVVHVMDGFHLEKAIKKVSSIMPEYNIRAKLIRAIEKEDKEEAGQVIEQMLGKPIEDSKKKTVREFRRYILNNWEAIIGQNYAKFGSCTEGQVSHVLSKRFSRTPMGWSKEGLGNLSLARVAVLNGEEITRDNFRGRKKNAKSYSEYFDIKTKEYLEGPFDWSIFEHEKQIFDLNSGTCRMLKQYGVI